MQPTYVLDCGRGGWRDSQGPGEFAAMAPWLEAHAPRYLFAPPNSTGVWRRVTPGFRWTQRLHDPAGLRPKLFTRG